jgi:nucleoside-diphosphate-sugar epimerase
MKTILLTGATGFVGKQIFKALRKSNVRIVPVVREGKESVYNSQHNVDRVVCSADIFQENSDWWAKQCNQIDVVIHAAWYVEHGKYLNSQKNMDCLIGSLNLAKGAATAGIKKFVGLGTCFEYDLSAGILSTETPINPLTPYAGSKAALFMGLSRWLPEVSVDFAWCRLFYLYGEGEDSRRLVPYLSSKLEKAEVAELTNGEQVRDYLDITIAAEMIVDCALGELNGPINICSGVPLSIRQLAESIADEYGRRDLLNFGARPDNSFEPKYIVGST